MRKVILFNLITLDGYFEGPNHDISWHNVDEEFNDFAHEQLHSTDLLLFGRVTYEMMAEFWTSETALREDPETAKLMNTVNKIVFSKTLENVDWANTTLIKNAEEELSKIKQRDGKDIFIFASSKLAVSLAKAGLIDEYRILVVPVWLGEGNSLMKGIDRTTLKFLDTRTFKNGNVLLRYETIQK